MPKNDDRLTTIHAKDRREWRAWLNENYESSPGGWLVYYKKNSGKPTVSYDEAVEEALCFGWIDSKVKALDEERYKQIFTPRKPRSVWSKLNKQRIEKLIEQGLMTDAGLAKIEAAKEDGSWNSLDNVEALIVSPELAEALRANKIAGENFNRFSSSSRKAILGWIESAKRSDTKRKRIEKTVTMAAKNKRANFDSE